MRVKILREGALLAIQPTHSEVTRVLENTLHYTRIRTLHGAEARSRGAHVESIPTDCFRYDRTGKRLLTNTGYLELVTERLKAAGHDVRYVDVNPHPKPEVFEPHWKRLDRFEFRHRQREVLELLVANEYARIQCPTGWGKTFIIGCLGLLWPKARIDVTTKSADICRNIYTDLKAMLPDVGLIGAGKRDSGHRVQVYGAGSLHHADGEADILVADEVHELGAPSYVEKLARYRRARMFGFSASQNDRLDKADFELHGLFGPLRIDVSYQEAEGAGAVSPIEVIWRSVTLDFNPCDGLDDVPRRRHGIWRNEERNKLVAEDAGQYDETVQVLVMVETIEHAMSLKKLLPDFELVYSEGGLSAEKRDYYVRHRYIDEHEPLMTPDRRDWLRRRFENGKLKKAIATSVWSRGVDFRRLQVLVRADAAANAIADKQIPGRVARTHDQKDVAVVHDYLDQFDSRFRMRAQKRRRNYAKNGWRQFWNERELDEETSVLKLFGEDDDD